MFDWTPLHFASQNGHLNVVEYLVNNKADIKAKDKYVTHNFLIKLLNIGHQSIVTIVLRNT